MYYPRCYLFLIDCSVVTVKYLQLEWAKSRAAGKRFANSVGPLKEWKKNHATNNSFEFRRVSYVFFERASWLREKQRRKHVSLNTVRGNVSSEVTRDLAVTVCHRLGTEQEHVRTIKRKTFNFLLNNRGRRARFKSNGCFRRDFFGDSRDRRGRQGLFGEIARCRVRSRLL